MSMRLEILVFGEVAATAGADRIAVEVPHGATSREVLAALAKQAPAFKGIAASARLAVNHAYARPDDQVSLGDEVALIALVGGG